MRQTPHCPREAEVLTAAQLRVWSDELRSHLESCPVCADAALVERFLQGEAVAAQTAILPTAQQIWWRAERRRRREAIARATRPIRIVQKIAWATGAATAVVLSAWAWKNWGAWVAGWLPSAASATEPLAGAGVLAAGLSAAGLGLVVLLYELYAAWAES